MLEEIRAYRNEKNSLFIKRIIPNCKPCLGLYTKDLKSIAKKLVQEKKFSFLEEMHEYYDEDLIHVLMITYIKDYDVMFFYLEKAIPLINNWAMCDQLVMNLKIVKKHKEKILKILERYRYSSNEYEVRFVLIMLLSHYCELEYKNYIFDVINTCFKDAYYIKMGIAWLLCECMIKMKEETLSYLYKTDLEDWIINKAIQKMVESSRITSEEKEFLKSLKQSQEKQI